MMPATGLRGLLRQQTRDLHQAVDDRFSASGAITTRAGYRLFLSTMAAMHAQFGHAADRAVERAGLAPRAGDHWQRLMADLGCHGVFPSVPVPGRHNPDVDAGVAYVLEGSALGAQLLLKQVRDAEIGGLGMGYLQSLCDERQVRWARYCRWLDTASVDEDGALQGARSVFGTILRRLD